MRRSSILLLGLDATALMVVCVSIAGADVDRASRGAWTTDVNAVVPVYAGIVLGCRVENGEVSRCLEERLEAGLELYRQGRIQRFLLTGDHGRPEYDEVNVMRAWLEDHDVPRLHIFLDHAGFDTYDSMIRAHKVFQVENAAIVSQSFHLPRSIYLARAAGISVQGFAADPAGGSSCQGSAWREYLTRVKAVWNARWGSSPRFLGPVIPITGDPTPSFDR